MSTSTVMPRRCQRNQVVALATAENRLTYSMSELDAPD